MNMRNLKKLLQTDSFHCKLGVEVIKFARNFSFLSLFILRNKEDVFDICSVFLGRCINFGKAFSYWNKFEMQGWINWAVYFENGLSPFFLILRYLRVCVWTGIKFFLWFCDRKHVKKICFFFFWLQKKLSRNEVEKLAIWQYFLISGKHRAYSFLILVFCPSQIKNYIITGLVSNAPF